MRQLALLISRWQNVIGWLAVAAFGKLILKWSVKDLLSAVMQEARDLLKLKPTVPGLNGMFVAAVLTTIIVLVFAPSVSRFFGMIQGSPASSLDPNKALMCLAICGIFSLVCVLRSDKR